MSSFSLFRRKSTRASTRLGASLLEAMAACVCATLFLLPTATMLSDASRWSARMENQSELQSLTEGCIDELQFQLTTNFRSGQSRNTFASKGFSQSRFDAQYSDRVSDGGIPGRFMVIHVVAWSDSNSNGAWDPSEPKFEVHTGMARRS